MTPSGRSGVSKMKRDLMDILACPECKGELRLAAETEVDGEVMTGSLLCSKCPHTYPIIDSIPNFLPEEMRQ